MLKLRNQKGFTLLEVLVALFCIVGLICIGVFGFYLSLLKGNFWYTQDGVLKALQADHPKVTEVLKTHRSIFGKSTITVKEANTTREYYLDTNILFNYSFSESE